MTREPSRYNLGVNATSCGLRPSEPMVGALRVPASKSLAQRAFVCAALCRDETLIGGLSSVEAGDDVRSARDLIRRAGAAVEASGDGFVRVRGLAPGPQSGWRARQPLELGESGTLARLTTAAAGFCAEAGTPVELHARGTLLARGSPALFAALAEAGVGIESLGRAHGWPVRLTPIQPPALLQLRNPGSSQEVSALLIATAAWPHSISLVVRGPIPSRPYLEMTIRFLQRFGVYFESCVRGDAEQFVRIGQLRGLGHPLLIEPDASAAAVLLGAACISRGEVSIEGLTSQSAQGDTRIGEHLAAFGCRSGFDARGLFAGGGVTRGANLDLSGEPDLAPVLAAVAACAALRCGARSQLTGLGTLQGKESARITVLASGLSALGVSVITTHTSLDIGPGHSMSGPLLLDPLGDHRMAFAFALLGLLRDGVDVLGPECVAKSWPDFWSDMERAGARVVRSTS